MQSLIITLKRGKNLLLYGAYVPTEYFVFDEHRIVYISIPKVACTSIKLAIEDVHEQMTASKQGVMSVHHKLSSRCTHSLNSRTSGYTVFSFVRNPFDRLVSCYEDKVKKPLQHNGHYYFSSPYNRVFLRRLFGAEFHEDMSFDEFVELVSRIPDLFADGHFKSQYSSLYKHGKRIPHIVGKFENLNDDWKPIADKFGLAELSASNRTNRSQWMDYYKSRKTIELARKRFKKDIESFDYGFSYDELIART